MTVGRNLVVLIAVSLLANAFCIPAGVHRRRRDNGNELQSEDTAPVSNEVSETASDATELPTTTPTSESITTTIYESTTTTISESTTTPTTVSTTTPATVSTTPPTTVSNTTPTTVSTTAPTTVSTTTPTTVLTPAPTSISTTTPTSASTTDDDDDDEDDFDEPMNVAPSGGGSNVFSLVRLASSLFPGSRSTANTANAFVREKIRQWLILKQTPVSFRRSDNRDNEIDIDYISDLTPPFQRQEIDNDDDSDSSDSNSDSDEHDDAAEESLEDETDDNGNTNASKQDSVSDAVSNNSNGDDSDYDDEPPGGGDGQGGGILGLLAGLSGGEDGESDLGSLLAAVSGIVASLSGDGFDLNSVIASGVGLFVGLLSEGEENPGAVIASYLLTSLDTITGGGAKKNGAFFAKFLSKLVKGTSADYDPDASSEEEQGMTMADSVGFVKSLLMSLLGDMSKTSSGGSSHPW